MDYPPDELIKLALAQALSCLARCDYELLDRNVNERSLTHKLAEHLQRRFPVWHVDCEYNRDGYDQKTLEVRHEDPSIDDTEARTVYPDIIVHRRGRPDNLLVIEVKKSSNTASRSFDRAKLEAFTGQYFHFRLGAMVELDVTGQAEGTIRWFRDGAEEAERSLAVRLRTRGVR